MLERCGAMAGPATSASEPRALQLVEVSVPRSSLGTMVARVWGRTPKMTRSPSSACTYTRRQGEALLCMILSVPNLYGHSASHGCAVAYMLEQHKGGMKRRQECQQETLNCLLGIKLQGCLILLAQHHQQHFQYRQSARCTYIHMYYGSCTYNQA